MNYPLAISEWNAIVKGLKSAYVSQNLLATDESAKIWYSLLRDIPYKLLNAAVMRWIATERFPPTIADLRNTAFKMTQPEKKDWSEAWAIVRKAVQFYGFYRKEDALTSMPEDVRIAADRIGWTNLCNMELSSEQIFRAQFRDIYSGISSKKTEAAILPMKVNELIGEIQNSLAIEMKMED